jgi:hypothetical protein
VRPGRRKMRRRGRKGRQHDKDEEERKYATRRRGDDATSRPGSCPFTM